MAIRRFRRITILASLLGVFLLYHFLSIRPELYTRSATQLRTPQSTPQSAPNEPPECPPLEGIEDVLVVMKTGVTEALDKVPVHFQTTLRCVPNYIIFSDFEEEIEGVKIHDALRTMDSTVRDTVADFNLYNRLREQGRAGLESADFADEANSNIGKPNNPGWKLDKWKFLPMVQQALTYKNNAKWYVFMEADTYFSWPTLLEWLSHFDPKEPHYIGTETQIADVIFAHGGSGFVVSNPAMQLASNEYATRTVELNEYTDWHWAGDCVLGKVLADAGVPLRYSWPILQNSNVGELDEFAKGFYRKPWCFPAVAFHHLTSHEIRDLYEFEKRRRQQTTSNVLLHRDVFKELIYPELSNVRDSWDNLSDEEHPAITDFHECKTLCSSSRSCAQFVMRDGICFTGETPRLGVRNPTARSGWILSTIEHMMDHAPRCPHPDFGL
ncbi:hypothetical protein CBS147343_1046 [Aspergillus niger]|uniref:N-acetylgalactosaminide beta-1,3-galactosyltransferase n=3 Tax=Aspergillus TaxID=5052 RepID=A0A370PRS4_ASPPH|nr:hypothetical protein ASPNIDRAFT_55640 [Aspergillus niger ATCC 1015]KAI2832975.1 hypothetical protein CBS133816_813 [Aspergillus niger]RDK44852.1 hypothetical protein M752DRAFT_324841 [Aspergillus phoenicis ATCC 13157]KAI2837505.1 hypothetical protein CBS11350_8709 [Aspergillus niger]KAI2845770.1 hypothetical protein CBS12448_9704 [Aspergillus niger]